MRCYHRIKLNIHKVVFMLIGIFISIYFAAYMVNLWGVTENNVEKKYVLDAVPSLNDDVKKENNEYDILNNDVTINIPTLTHTRRRRPTARRRPRRAPPHHQTSKGGGRGGGE
ncbi:hypothetical protein CG709_04735, partial [Lachnotalea glycerini]